MMKKRVREKMSKLVKNEKIRFVMSSMATVTLYSHPIGFDPAPEV